MWERLSKIGGKLLVQTLKLVEEGKVERKKQGDNFTRAPILSKEMANINWENQTAEQIKNLVRGLNPIIGAYSFLNGKKVKFWKVKVLSEEELLTQFKELLEYKYKLQDIQSGTIMFAEPKKGLFIKANEGILKVLEIQAENSKRMSIEEFLRGNSLQAGSIFEN